MGIVVFNYLLLVVVDGGSRGWRSGGGGNNIIIIMANQYIPSAVLLQRGGYEVVFVLVIKVGCTDECTLRTTGG